MTRTLVAWALVLTVLLGAASALIRLSQSGLSCTQWPQCYGERARPGLRAPEQPPVAETVARAVHRVAASVVGLIVIALPWLATRREHARDRAAARARWIAIAITVGLALLGVYTPTGAPGDAFAAVPAVAIGNLLGGLALAAVLAWAWQHERASQSAPRPPQSAQRPPRRSLQRLATLALALVALQAALGGTIAVRRATLDCEPLARCLRTLADPEWRALDPRAATADVDDAARRTVHASHRVFGLAALAAIAAVAWHAIRAGGARREAGTALAALALVQAALGALLPWAGYPLAVAVVHYLVAALIVVMLARLLAMPSTTGEAR